MGLSILPDSRPFLKWAGGKRQLLGPLLDSIRRLGSFGAYHEPFVGGGAVFFELRRLGMPGGAAFLSDVNERLIEAYQGVAGEVEAVIALLKDHAARHDPDHYLEVRASLPDSLAARAARIIYLNRTCFNGLYRENSRGEFNVPIGRYTNPAICDEPRLRAASEALRTARIECRPFETVLDRANPGDLVYFDPPYVPVSKTASFTAYAKQGFGPDDQARLASVFRELASRGVHVMLSNSWTDTVLCLYSEFHTHRVKATRAVNSRADRRGEVAEAIVTSF
jgi:DNA adenine methylase